MLPQVTVFGPKGDIQPLSLSVIKNHCTIERHEEELTLIGGAGQHTCATHTRHTQHKPVRPVLFFPTPLQ
jgi:hypothetical protein